ncbi:MAG: putative toxin-antitoxin system toxin component, PIN family [Limisphaerales bacterium]
MRLFLDTSVLLAACGSAKGASREVFRLATLNQWTLIATPYVLAEVKNNLTDLPPGSGSEWNSLQAELLVMDDVLTVDRLAVFDVPKDRPILFGALAWADVLLTLDRADFGRLLGTSFYNLAIMAPGQFLLREREAVRLKEN